MNTSKPIIGILGGMGPRATVKFEDILLDKLPGTDQELPTIITINDGSTPDRSSFLLGKGADPVPVQQKNLDLLEQAGATIICIPCNTSCAPAIFDRLKAHTSLPIINLPDEVSKQIKNMSLEAVFLLATEGTVKSDVYQNVCAANAIRCIEPDNNTQELATKVISAVKNNDMITARAAASKIKPLIERSGAKGVILGCAELPLVVDELVPSDCTPIDTLDVLAQATAAYVK
ncbi:MAG TPA: amino acid racemase [Candidatus Saccharimonadales bacterium]|nr:amino acid racemase [Candidatus Saccharimonadales bacterium]